MYLRENLLNVAVKKIPENDWEYILWIDAHQFFENSYWWEEFIIKAERAPILQLYQRTARLNDFNQSYPGQRRRVIYQSFFTKDVDNLGFTEIGNAYGMNKEMYREMKYIADECIATCCDCIFIRAFLPEKEYLNHNTEPSWPYFLQFTDWLLNARKVFKCKKEFVRGTLYHFTHPGIPYYEHLQKLVTSKNFSIRADLGRDENGTLFLTNKKMKSELAELIKNLIKP
jgi:hypothetical protein